MANITAREFYALVLDATRDSDAEDFVTMYNYALEAMEKLDKRNEARKSKDSKEKLEAAARREAVLGVLTQTALTRDDIAVAANVTPGQATAALTALVKDGKAAKSEIKVGKSTKMVYALV